MEYLTTIEMSVKWGITSRRIAVLCEQGSNVFLIAQYSGINFPHVKLLYTL